MTERSRTWILTTPPAVIAQAIAGAMALIAFGRTGSILVGVLVLLVIDGLVVLAVWVGRSFTTLLALCAAALVFTPVLSFLGSLSGLAAAISVLTLAEAIRVALALRRHAVIEPGAAAGVVLGWSAVVAASLLAGFVLLGLDRAPTISWLWVVGSVGLLFAVAGASIWFLARAAAPGSDIGWTPGAYVPPGPGHDVG